VGIFRFKNQTGVETEPTLIAGKLTSFQAKYYGTSFGSNKADIIDSFRKAKSKNPELQKVLQYTNQELSESRNSNQQRAKCNKKLIHLEIHIPMQFCIFFKF
jgi:hypothetical protein